MKSDRPTKRRWGSAAAGCRVALILFALPLVSGCYTYTVTPLDAIPRGHGLRLIVSRAGAAEFASALDTTSTVPTFQGTLEERDNGSLMVRVPLPTDPTTGSTVVLSQVVRVPTAEIIQVERRDFSPMRTSGLIAGAGAVSYLIIRQITSLGANDPGEEGPDPEVLFNVLRIPIGE